MPDDYDYDDDPPAIAVPNTPEVDIPRRKLRRLYGPDGKVIRTYSNRPPTGFHQGQRNTP